jgi:hypothetical protein
LRCGGDSGQNTGAVVESMELEAGIGLRTFQHLLSQVAAWAWNEEVVINEFRLVLPPFIFCLRFYGLD